MPSDWSDRERASKELARRESRAPDGPQAESPDLDGIRRLPESLEAEVAGQTEDIAAVAAMLRRRRCRTDMEYLRCARGA